MPFGPHPQRIEGGVVVEEGGDHDFMPDHRLKDGAVIHGADWTVTALHTPGHISNHLCFGLHEEKALFTGDHVMGWSTTVISPPDGSMTDYYVSLKKLLFRDAGVAADLAKLIEGEFAHAPRVRDERDRSLLRARLPEAFARLLSPLL